MGGSRAVLCWLLLLATGLCLQHADALYHGSADLKIRTEINAGARLNRVKRQAVATPAAIAAPKVYNSQSPGVPSTSTEVTTTNTSRSTARSTALPSTPSPSANDQLLTDLLQNSTQLNSTGTVARILKLLANYTSNNSGSLSPSKVALILKILQNIALGALQLNQSLSVNTSMDIISIVDQLLNEGTWTAATGQNSDFGPQLLQLVENLLIKMTDSDEPINKTCANVELHSTSSPCSQFINDSIVAFLPRLNLSYPRQADKNLSYEICKIRLNTVIYKTLALGFPPDLDNSNRSLNRYSISSDIMTNIMLVNNKSSHFVRVNMTFSCKNQLCDQSAICVFWNASLKRWSSDGCQTHVINGVTSCLCHHLTSYAVLMSGGEPQIDKVNDAILNYVTNVGLGISIASLILCLVFQAVLLQATTQLTSSYRHVSTLNIALFLLISNISFFASGLISVGDQDGLCFALTFCTHLSLLAFLFWTLVQTLFLVCRLVFVFHHVTKRQFTAAAVIAGYACPLIFACGAFMNYYPMQRYRKKNVCWLENTTGASNAFTLPTIVILVGNFIGLAVVIRKLLRPNISEGTASEDDEVVKKLAKAVLFCIPQFGLTWAVGIPLLIDSSSVILNYLFVLLNPLQGFFLLLFGCLLDKKAMQLVKKQLFGSSSQSASTLSTSSS